KPTSQATNPAVAILPHKSSIAITSAKEDKNGGLTARYHYTQLDTTAKMPNNISDRYKPMRAINAPPAKAPTMVVAKPNTLFTVPTSAALNPAPRNKNVVDNAPAKASPNLYSTISSRMVHAPRRPKNSSNGCTTASPSVRGALLTC